MNHKIYEHICSEANAGRDSFVRHPESNEEGLVTNCILQSGHMVVKTSHRETRCWDFVECEKLIDLKSRTMV